MSFANEKTVETKSCNNCSISFDITDKDLEFYDKISPIFNDEKYSIPTPKLCPACRNIRRMSWYNEANIYKNYDYEGNSIISMYAPNIKRKLLKTEIFLSENNNIKECIDFDFSKMFFEQFDTLIKKSFLPNLDGIFLENSPYVNNSGFLKSCYLIFQSNDNEKCYYGRNFEHSNNCMDCFIIINSSFCYECVKCSNSYGLFYSENSTECKNSYFLKNCSSCENCFCCVNLVNKKYYIFNKSYTKEKYFNIIEKYCVDIGKYKEKFEQIKKNSIMKSIDNILSTDIIGDGNVECNNIYNGFDNFGAKDIKHSILIKENGNDICDSLGFGMNFSLGYELVISGFNSSNVSFSSNCWDNISNITYCYFCVQGSNNLFGCVGLKNKQYCILNKQYTPEEYNILVPKIINHMKETGEWGEFFPSSISPFGYNETVAQEYFPLEKDEAINKKFNWSDYEAPLPKVDKVIPAKKLPQNISDIPDDILNWAIECEITKKPFRIIAQELEFYRKHSLPIPKRHPDQRHLDRMKLRNPRKLFKRDCDKCGVEMDTTYSPEREEIVYCEECYNKEIY